MAYQTRTLDWVIGRAFAHANRKATPPAQGTPKYQVLAVIADDLQRQWANEPGTEWTSLYNFFTLPSTVTANQDTYALDPTTPTIDYISKRAGDYIKLVSPDTTVTKHVLLIDPNQLYEYRYQDAMAQNKRNLIFSQKPTTGTTFLGYSIIVPGYQTVNDLINPTDVVQVDNPDWLAYACAAEYVRNDYVRGAQYPNLLNMADQAMQKMKQANQGQYESVASEWIPMGMTWV